MHRPFACRTDGPVVPIAAAMLAIAASCTQQESGAKSLGASAQSPAAEESLPAFQLARKPAGQWQDVPWSSREPGARNDANWRAMETRIQTKSFGGAGTVEGARLAMRTMLIVGRRSDLDTEAIAKAFIHGIRAIPSLERIDFLPAGNRPPVGEPRPDVTVWISFGGKADGTSEALHAEATADTDWFSGDVMRAEGAWSAQLVTFHHHSESDLVFRRDGAGDADQDRDECLEALGASLAREITRYFQELGDANGLAPELPDAFWPNYEPTPTDLPLDLLGELEQRVSWRAPLHTNVTWWGGVLAGELEESLGRFAHALEGAGYKTNDSGHNRLFRNGDRDLLFVVDDGSSADNAAGTEVHVRFRQRMPEAQRLEALDATLAADARPSLLPMFVPTAGEEFRERALQALEAQSPRTARAMLTRATLRAAAGQTDGATDDLYVALAMAQTAVQDGEAEQAVVAKARELGIPLDAAKTTKAQLLAAGFVELDADNPSVSGAGTPEQPLRAFFDAGDGFHLISACRLHSDPGSPCTIRKSRAGVSSTSTSTIAMAWVADGKRITAGPIEVEGKPAVELRLQP